MSKHTPDSRDIDTGVSNPEVGQCEGCGEPVRFNDAVTETYPGPEGRIVLMFCPECARGE